MYAIWHWMNMPLCAIKNHRMMGGKKSSTFLFRSVFSPIWPARFWYTELLSGVITTPLIMIIRQRNETVGWEIIDKGTRKRRGANDNCDCMLVGSTLKIQQCFTEDESCVLSYVLLYYTYIVQLFDVPVISQVISIAPIWVLFIKRCEKCGTFIQHSTLNR